MRTIIPTFCLIPALLAASVGTTRAAKPVFHWERMTVTQAAPTQVFARLGMTHFTRYGYTRDGFKKTDPDPTFPLGLTDVVPKDLEHVLLVRGTDEALVQFRARVGAMAEQIATERWHLKLELLPKVSPGANALGAPIEQNLPSERPVSLALAESSGLHIYQMNVHVSPDGSLALACRTGLPLPAPPPVAAAPGGPEPRPLAPTLVWTDAIVKTTPPGGTVLFDDLASDRQALRRRVGLPDAPVAGDGAADYQLRVTVSAPEAPPAPPSSEPGRPSPN